VQWKVKIFSQNNERGKEGFEKANPAMLRKTRMQPQYHLDVRSAIPDGQLNTVICRSWQLNFLMCYEIL
jgi:hypothetical protein